MTGIGPWRLCPEYRIGGKVAEVFFAPIQKLDERIRPEYWQFDFR